MDDRLLEQIRTRHHLPPEPPRERMWVRIAADRGRRRRARASWRAGFAAAAMLAIGILIGRVGLSPAPAPSPIRLAPIAEREPALSSGATLARYSAARLFVRADALLTEIQVGAGDGEPVADWSRQMLTQTRLLLDSPLTADPQLAALLRDLELILARIAAMSSHDVEAIRDDIRATNAIDRLRDAASVVI